MITAFLSSAEKNMKNFEKKLTKDAIKTKPHALLGCKGEYKMFLMAMAQENTVVLDEQLISQIAEKNQDALRTLYELTNKQIYGFAYSILKNSEDASDIVQDTYVRIYQAAHMYKNEGKPMAWILRITRNLALMKIRNAKKSTTFAVDDDILEDSGESFTTNSVHKIVLTKALAQLSDESAQIIVLHAVSGLKHREIADVMGLNLSTVLSKYNRSVKKIKSILEEENIYE